MGQKDEFINGAVKIIQTIDNHVFKYEWSKLAILLRRSNIANLR